jgi:hypothetical protein
MSFNSYDRGFGIYILFREYNENYSMNSKLIKTEDLTKVDEIEKEIISLLFHCISDSIKVPNIAFFIGCDKNLSIAINTYKILFDIYHNNQPKNAFILFIEYLKSNYIEFNLRKIMCLHSITRI